jgi:excisionase family DNA binding protein
MTENEGGQKALEFFTVDELAVRFKVKKLTIYRLVRKGELPAYHIGRAMRFRLSDVEKFLESVLQKEGTTMPPTYQDFQQELDNIFVQETAAGKGYVDVWSTDLHRTVGSYPGPDHRMPVCNKVMRDNMKPGDQVLKEPPKKQGKICIRYLLPRQGKSATTGGGSSGSGVRRAGQME